MYHSAVSAAGHVFIIAVDLAVLLFAVSIHESAHARVALALGDPTAREGGRLSLNPLRHLDPVGSILVPLTLAIGGAPVFGWAKPVPVHPDHFRDPNRGMALVSAAGPLANLAAAAAAGGLLVLLQVVFPGTRPVVRGSLLAAPQAGVTIVFVIVAVLRMSVTINLILAVFNLLPVPPLDGAGVVEGLAPKTAGAAFGRMRGLGWIVVFVLLWTGVLDGILDPVLAAVYRLILR